MTPPVCSVACAYGARAASAEGGVPNVAASTSRAAIPYSPNARTRSVTRAYAVTRGFTYFRRIAPQPSAARAGTSTSSDTPASQLSAPSVDTADGATVASSSASTRRSATIFPLAVSAAA